MQVGTDPNAAALVKSVNVTASGNVIKASASLPQDMFIQMLSPKGSEIQRHTGPRRK
jgi:hypothetical protein